MNPFSTEEKINVVVLEVKVEENIYGVSIDKESMTPLSIGYALEHLGRKIITSHALHKEGRPDSP